MKMISVRRKDEVLRADTRNFLPQQKAMATDRVQSAYLETQLQHSISTQGSQRDPITRTKDVSGAGLSKRIATELSDGRSSRGSHGPNKMFHISTKGST